MQPISLLLLFLCYFVLLLVVSWLVGRKSKTATFYNGDRKSPWPVVAFGMVGATLSGVTFISVPGEVGNSNFHYFQFVMGNVIGYVLIATFLLPYYYRKNIISIYSVLEEKTGREGYLTTSGFFIISKVIGASFRLFLAALVIHLAIAGPLGIPFPLTVLACLLLIWLYTVRSGIKAVVWSDTLQTLMLLIAVAVSIFVLIKQMDTSVIRVTDDIRTSGLGRVFEFDWRSPQNFYKQVVAGIFMTIALNGFDQDIVQKNLTCKTSSKARSNMLVFSVLFGVSVLIFMFLGALLYLYAQQMSVTIPSKTDELFPLIALNHLGKGVQVLFVLGISAAAFSSADSATTALTTAFSIDFLNIGKWPERKQKQVRNLVHLSFSLVIFAVIMLFYYLNSQSVVVAIFKAAGYTYGPIFGVFMYSFISKRRPVSKFILPICIASPLITWLITIVSHSVFNGYRFGFELIVVNATITYLLLSFFSKRH
jgi:solute:Na+ symporter, SSS family